jgi:hypothetical protein
MIGDKVEAGGLPATRGPRSPSEERVEWLEVGSTRYCTRNRKSTTVFMPGSASWIPSPAKINFGLHCICETEYLTNEAPCRRAAYLYNTASDAS